MILKALMFVTASLLVVSADNNKRGRIFSIFNVVRFVNSPCATSVSQRAGLCYSMEDCLARGGEAAGSCASGFGVCCYFSVGCNSIINENCTFFTSDHVLLTNRLNCISRACSLSQDICQLRLDFEQFQLAGPSTSTTLEAFTLNGVFLDDDTAQGVTFATRCLTDFFAISNGGVHQVICGLNTGEHLFVDFNDGANSCVEMQLFVGPTLPLFRRYWSIKVSQLKCESSTAAPTGCDQWHFGTNRGIVKSFNFDGGIHLANQRQSICVRQERGTCSICWYVQEPEDFQLSGPGLMGITDENICCNYGRFGDDTRGYDCLLIPNASSVAGGIIKANRFCGSSKGLALLGSQTSATVNPVTMGIKLDQTICSKMTPFQIRFISDAFEFQEESRRSPRGFRLQYQLKACQGTLSSP